MKVLVAVKRVVDPNVKVRAKADNSGVDIANAKLSINPFDEIAIEEAVRWKESGAAGEVIAVSCGVAACQETLRTALAMGADRAILAETNSELQPLAVAKLLAAVASQEAVQVVMLGKQAIDDDANQVGQMVAALLDWPQATFASRITLAAELLTVVREIDGGLETLEVRLPAVVTTLPNIIKAKKKPLQSVTPEALGVDVAPRLTMVRVSAPPKRQAGIKLANAAELVARLKNEVKLI
jgi:electron transfer flavoprotein beta subunit